MEATTLWWLCDGAIVSGGEKRGGAFVIDLHGELGGEGLGGLYYELMVKKDSVSDLLEFRRQRDRFFLEQPQRLYE